MSIEKGTFIDDNSKLVSILKTSRSSTYLTYSTWLPVRTKKSVSKDLLSCWCIGIIILGRTRGCALGSQFRPKGPQGPTSLSSVEKSLLQRNNLQHRIRIRLQRLDGKQEQHHHGMARVVDVKGYGSSTARQCPRRQECFLLAFQHHAAPRCRRAHRSCESGWRLCRICWAVHGRPHGPQDGSKHAGDEGSKKETAMVASHHEAGGADGHRAVLSCDDRAGRSLDG